MGKKKGKVSPASWNVFPGGHVTFTFTVGGKTVPAKWRLSQPAIGKMNADTGEFLAAKDYTFDSSEVIAETKEHQGTATIRVMVHHGLSDAGPVFADGYWGLDCLPWTEKKGIRGAKLIIDALHQLPEPFLKAVNGLAIVRLNKPGWAPEGLSGMHLPLPKRVMLIEDGMFQALPNHPEVTGKDLDFVFTFIHELAHVVLADACLDDGQRWLAIIEIVACLALLAAALAAGAAIGPILALLGTIGGPELLAVVKASVATGAIVIIALPAAVLVQYYWPFSQVDMASRFAQVAGWRIRSPNPTSWFKEFPDLVVPNVVTGFGFVGHLVGLKNIEKPARDGAVSQYARTDVHEDFADTVASLALGFSSDDKYVAKDKNPLPPGTFPTPTMQKLAKIPRFKARRKMLAKEGVWSFTASPIDVGSTILKYARSLTSGPKPDFDKFAVFLGNYAGKPATGGPGVKSASKTKSAVKKSLSAKRAKITGNRNEEDNDADEPAGDDQDDGLGEGEAQDWDRDEIEFALRLQSAFAGLQAGTEFFQEHAQPTVDRVAETLSQMEHPGPLETYTDFLASAACHGSGLRRVSLAEAALDLREDDLLFTDDALPWIVKKIENGVVTQVIGVPKPDPEKRLDKIEFVLDPARVVCHWRPAADLHRWYAGQDDDEALAFAEAVRLWHQEETDEYLLDGAGSFVTEVFRRLGRRLREVAGLQDKEFKAYCTEHGGLGEPTNLQPKDVVRMKGGLWAVVLSTEPLFLLVQGGGKGLFNEPKASVKLLIGCEPELLLQVWRP